MKMPLILLAAVCAALMPLDAAETTNTGSKKPNFVFILIDDIPWFSTPVRMDPDMPESAMAFRHMPHVETLASQGMVFRNARSVR